MTERRILVTGATGFVGRSLVPRLLSDGYRVTALAREPSRARFETSERLRIARGEMDDPVSLAAAAAGCDAAVHLAAATDVSDSAVNRRLNVEGSDRVAAACKSAGISRFIHFSSHCAGRELRDAYGVTKLQSESVIRESGLSFTIFRPTMLCGPGSKEFETFVAIVRRWPVVPIVGSGTFGLRPALLEDVLPLVGRALELPAAAGASYVVAGADRIELRALIEMVARAQGLRRRVLSLPAGPTLAAVRLLGALMTHTPIAVDQVLAMLQETEADIEPARRELAYRPRPLEAGLGWLSRS